MTNKARQTVIAEKNQVDRLLREGVEDKEIMRMLNMSVNTYYRLKKKIFEEEAKVFKQQTVEDLAYKSNTLRSRLVKLFNLAERKLESAADTAKGDMNPTKDFASTLAQAKEIAINIFELETQGIKIATSEFNRNIHRIEDKELLPELPATTEPIQPDN